LSSKNKVEVPTVEEFLHYKPKRLDFEWFTNDEGLVEINVPKFKGNLGKSFCKLIKKENLFTAHLDKLGSLIWKNCTGENTVKKLLDMIKKEYPNEKNIDQRFFVFLQQMKGLSYIDY